jgi:ubiquinone/menaquinone biosynthesis C-methylase UbiE
MNIARLYDRMAPFYEAAWPRIQPWREYSFAVMPWLPDRGDLLEVGPGPGLLLEALAARPGRVVALDIAAEMLRRAQARLRARGLHALLIRGDILAPPLASARFDAIVMTFVFSAVPDGPRAMHQLARLLRPQGRLILVDACIPADANLPARILARLWALFGDQMRDEAALMRATGLEVIHRREFGAFHSIRITVGRKPA